MCLMHYQRFRKAGTTDPRPTKTSIRINAEGMVRCSRCKEFKDKAQFSPEKQSGIKLKSWCKKCVGTYHKQMFKDNPDRRKDYQLKTEYGMSLEQWWDLFEDQCGVCACCFTPPDIPGQDLCVDHCHHTGRVRGLICTGCNQGLGHFHDNIGLLQQAIRYLETKGRGIDGFKGRTNNPKTGKLNKSRFK